MAVKTITIDLEAYRVLVRRKRPGQSFSQVIKEHLGKLRTAKDLLDAAPRFRLSKETLDAIEAQVKSRRQSPLRRVRL